MSIAEIVVFESLNCSEIETMGHHGYFVVADTTRAVQVKMILIRRETGRENRDKLAREKRL